MANIDTKSKVESLQILEFKINNKDYAVDIGTIREIIHFRAASVLPNSPDFVEGVIDLRGKVVPVLNLKKRLGIPHESKEVPHHILILCLKNKTLGLIVDEVKQVHLIDEASIQAPQNIIRTHTREYLRGICRLQERLIFILSVDALLSLDEQAQLEEI